MLTSIKTWAYKKWKNVIVIVNDNLKDRISVIASTTSDNEKLPLFFITKTNVRLEDLNNNNKFTIKSWNFYIIIPFFLKNAP